jgi:hypothetical protein
LRRQRGGQRGERQGDESTSDHGRRAHTQQCSAARRAPAG